MSASSADIAYFYIALPSEKIRRRVYDSKDQLWALCLMLGLEMVAHVHNVYDTILEYIDSMDTGQEAEKHSEVQDFGSFVENLGLDIASALYANRPALETVYELLDAYHGEKATLETHYHELARMYALTVRENTDLRNSETALVNQIEQNGRVLSMKDLKTCLWKKSLEAEIELLRNNKIGKQASGSFSLTADCRATPTHAAAATFTEMAKLEGIDNLKEFHAALSSIKDTDTISIDLSKHRMVPVTFETLTSSSLDIPLVERIIAGACIGQLLRLAPINCQAAMRPLLMVIPHAVLDTLPLFEEFLYRAVHGHFTDIKHATLLAKTFTAMTQKYIDVIADVISAAKLPMEAMLAVAAYPALDVASAAYGFWSKLHQTLTSSTPAAMDSAAQHKTDFFDYHFRAFIAKVVEGARTPTFTATWTEDDWQRFTELRTNLGAIMLRLAGFLGMHTVLSTLLEPILSLASQPQEAPVVRANTRSAEAALHAVASMFAAPHSALLSSPYEDDTLLILFNQLPRLPHDETLHKTGLELTSAAAAWLAGAFQVTEMGAHLKSNLIPFITDVLVASPLQSAAKHALCTLRAAEDGYKSIQMQQAMTASEVSSEASEQDTYCTSELEFPDKESCEASEQDTYCTKELEFPDKESCNYEAAVYQGWQGSLFSTSNPTAASQVDAVYLGWAGGLFSEKTTCNMGSSDYEAAVVEGWDGALFAPSSPSAASEEASIREDKQETLTQQRLAAMAQETPQDLGHKRGRLLQQPQPVPYLQAIIETPSALTFSLDALPHHTHSDTSAKAASGPARQVLFSKKRRFQKMKQWVVEKAANAKTKAAKLFNCLAPKAAQ